MHPFLVVKHWVRYVACEDPMIYINFDTFWWPINVLGLVLLFLSYMQTHT